MRYFSWAGNIGADIEMALWYYYQMKLRQFLCKGALAVALMSASWIFSAEAKPIHGDAIDDASPAPALASAPAAAAPVASTGGIVSADFQTLASFPFVVPDMTATNHPTVAQAEKQIPASIRQLDGKEVRIRGFMMPVKEVQGKTTEFLIMRGQPSCCFSGATEINEFVTVKTPPPGFATMLDDPIAIEGKLHVGALTDSGFIVGVYQLDADKLVAPGK